MTPYKTRVLLAAATIACLQANAQKKQFTIAEATNGMATTLAPKGLKNATWQPGTHNLWQTDKKSEVDIWKITNISDKETTAQEVEQGTYPEKIAIIPPLK